MVVTRSRDHKADSQVSQQDSDTASVKSKRTTKKQSSKAQSAAQPEVDNTAINKRSQSTRKRNVSRTLNQHTDAQAEVPESQSEKIVVSTRPAPRATRAKKAATQEVNDEPTVRSKRGAGSSAPVKQDGEATQTSTTVDEAAPSQTGSIRRSARNRKNNDVDTQETLSAGGSQIAEHAEAPNQSRTAKARAPAKGRAKAASRAKVPEPDLSTPIKKTSRKKRPQNATVVSPVTPVSLDHSMDREITPLPRLPSPEFLLPTDNENDQLDVELGDETETKKKADDKIVIDDADRQDESSGDELQQPDVITSHETLRKKALKKSQEASSPSKAHDEVDELSHKPYEEADSTMFDGILTDDEDDAAPLQAGPEGHSDDFIPVSDGEPQQAVVEDEDSFARFEDSEVLNENSLLLPDIQSAATLSDNILDLEGPISLVEHAADTEDLDVTELNEDAEGLQSPASSDRSVIRTQIEVQDEAMVDIDDETAEVDDGDDYTQLSLTTKTPRPQTIQWESIQPTTVVRHNLEQNFAMSISPHINESQLGIMPDQLSSPTKQEIAAQVEQQYVETDQPSVEFTDFVTIPANQALPSSPTQDASLVNTNNTADDVFSIEAATGEEHSVEVETRDTPSDEEVPHYMNSTIAFDARRKSMPNRAARTPVKPEPRPKTSDGGKDEALQSTYDEPWWLKAKSTLKPATTTPVLRRNVAPFATSTRWHASTPIATPAKRVEHANTIAVPSRHRTVAATPVKTPVAIARELLTRTARTPTRTPARTPLRSLMGMSSMSSMTSHPIVPLRGVVAIVEVYTSEGASASAPFINILHRLGAKTTKLWGDRITHVVFKDGPPAILQRVLVHNRKVLEGNGTHIHCVNSRWVSDSDSNGARALETDQAYAVNTGELSVNRRKRKSMEPSTVVNVDGSLFKRRKNSWGRSLSGRLLGSPLTSSRVPSGESVGKENSASPVPPAWPAAPESLAQSTVPVKRVRKLDSTGLDQYKARRRSFWNDN